jgi:hypothetical protein
MSDETSLVKAKYAAAVLKVAQTAEKRMAAMLVEGLASEFPASDDRPDIAKAHLNAIEVFGSLVDSIRGPAGGQSLLWKTAFEATERWRRLLI